MKTAFKVRALVEVDVIVYCGRDFGVKYSIDEVIKEKFGEYNNVTLLEVREDEQERT